MPVFTAHTAIIGFAWPYDRTLFQDIANKVLEVNADTDSVRNFTTLITVAPSFEGRRTGEDFTHFITVGVVWTGIDNGSLYENTTNYEKYIQQIKDAVPLVQPMVIYDRRLPLHLAASTLITDFEQAPGYRYHVHGIGTDNFLETDFMLKVADEIDERLLIKGLYPEFQTQILGGLGAGSQLNRNAGLNSFPWRKIVINIDDWLFFDDGKKDDMVRARIEAFRETTADTHLRDDGESEMALWITTDTNIAEDAALSKLWPHYYPSCEVYLELQSVKLEYDPRNLFSSDMTVPPGPTLAACEKFAVHNPRRGCGSFSWHFHYWGPQV
jgi:hypothetical protein